MKIDKPVRRILKSIARKNETYSQIVKRRIKCDADGCDAAGTNEIHVKAGKFGTVTLFVCPECVGKFLEEENENAACRQQDTTHSRAALVGFDKHGDDR